MSTSAIDYDKLAAEHGGKPAGEVDYDALAAEHGGKAATTGNTPAADPSFFKKHNLLRETLLGAMGTYAPESAHPLNDTVSGLKALAAPPETAGDYAGMAVGGPLGVMGKRIAQGIGSQIKKGATEIYEGAGSPKIGLHSVSIQPMDEEKIAHGIGTGLGLTSQAAIPLAEEKVSAGASKVRGMLPSAERAGSTLGQVKAAAGTLPVDPSGYGDSILRVKELADRGGTMPTAVNKLLQRITNPKLGPLTFEEARDFYSNVSRLSVDEMNKLTPTMKRAVGDLRVKLGDTLANTADQVGMGDQYRAAMKEYAQAADMKERLADVKAHLIKYGTMTAAGWAGIKAAEIAIGKSLMGFGN